MLPGLTADQRLFQDTTTRFIKSACPLSAVRAQAEQPGGDLGQYLRQAGELGWFALLVSESNGGGSPSGDGIIDAGLIAEQRGRFLQPAPVVASNVVALALELGGSTESRQLLPALAGGDVLATWALADGHGRWDPATGVGAVAVDGGFLLSGTKSFVQDAELAGWLLVSAAFQGRPALFLVPSDSAGLSTTALAGLDITRRFARIELADVLVPASAVVGPEDPHLANRLLDVAAVLSVAETVGAMTELFAMTLDYAKERSAFGRPIGSFQAVKHQLSDLSLSLRCSQAIATAALNAVQAGAVEASELASAAKAFVGDTVIDLAQGCLQIHGGIGYTWEHDLHLYLRRLAVDRVLYGEPAWHRERICQIHGL